MEVIKKMILDFLRGNQITSLQLTMDKSQIDMMSLVRKLNFDVREAMFADENIQATLFVDESVDVANSIFDSNKVIAYDLSCPKATANFILAYFLSRYIMEKNKGQGKEVLIEDALKKSSYGSRKIDDESIDLNLVQMSEILLSKETYQAKLANKMTNVPKRLIKL